MGANQCYTPITKIYSIKLKPQIIQLPESRVTWRQFGSIAIDVLNEHKLPFIEVGSVSSRNLMQLEYLFHGEDPASIRPTENRVIEFFKNQYPTDYKRKMRSLHIDQCQYLIYTINPGY